MTTIENMLEFASEKVNALRQEVHRRIVGQDEVIDLVMVALFAPGSNNHVLLEGVPGIAKTELLKAFATATNVAFKRIQMTPDMHPRDITGFDVPNPSTGEWEFRRGPIFTNFLLADELNRTPPKTASALLEAMQELQVTTESQGTIMLPEPFMVFATQNPIEQEGTYPLAEAQKDRFLMKIFMGYPNEQDEFYISRIVNMPAINHIMGGDNVIGIRKLVKSTTRIDPVLEKKIVRLVRLTRPNEGFSAVKNVIDVGASPRAAMALRRASMAHAFISKRNYVVPQDILRLAPAVLSHRVVFAYGIQPLQRTIALKDILCQIANNVFGEGYGSAIGA